MSGSGWADYAYNSSNAANPYSTGIVLTGLSMVGAKMSAYPQIKDAISFLIGAQSSDGSWSENDISTAFSLMGISNFGALGVSISASPTTPQPVLTNQSGTQTLTYTLTITNTGAFDVTDTYAITASGGLPDWIGTLSQSSVTLASGASTTVTLTVTAPANITDSLPDNRTVTATSGTNSAIYAKVAVNSYSGNPPPTQGQTVQSTIPTASQNIVVTSRTQVVHFSATVIDANTNQPVTGTGNGVVIFYVGGNAVGTRGRATATAYLPTIGLRATTGSSQASKRYRRFTLDSTRAAPIPVFCKRPP